MVGRETGAPGEDEPRFRIRVCMRRYFADERARCLLLVSARRRVRWLARRLRALFPLPPRTALLSRGHLLPRDEPLALLDADDLVEVVPRRAGLERGDIADARDEAAKDVVDSRASARDEADVVRSDARETDRDWEMADVPPSPAAETDELRDSKRRALAELERYCAPAGDTSAAAAPRARRRRVRRRRAAAPEPSGLADSSAGEAWAAGDAVAAAAAVRADGRPRAPRLVRALPGPDDVLVSLRVSPAADDGDLSVPPV